MTIRAHEPLWSNQIFRLFFLFVFDVHLSEKVAIVPVLHSGQFDSLAPQPHCAWSRTEKKPRSIPDIKYRVYPLLCLQGWAKIQIDDHRTRQSRLKVLNTQTSRKCPAYYHLQCRIQSIFDLPKNSFATLIMEPGKKKSFIVRNIEWIALIILILSGLFAIWRMFYPGLFSNW